MPQYTQPPTLPDWGESSDALVSQPTPSQQASGFTLNQRPSASTVNWLFRTLGRSIRWLSQGVNAVLVGAFQEPDFRLLNGGSWSWNAATGTLAWSSPFQLQMPGLADAANEAAAGSVVLTAGQVAYVASNTPFSTTGNTTSGSAVVTSLAYESGVAAGLSVSGPGIPANTTVQSVSAADNSVTLTNAATATASNVQIVFATSGPLTVKAADVATFAPSSSTVVIARCVAGTPNFVHVGVNSGQMRLLDGEAKALLGNGYVSTMRATAGAAIAARQPVYLSPGAADGRTAGAAYPLDVSATGTATRAALAGVAASAAASGAVVEIVMAGKMPGFTGLLPGQTYYASPGTPASLQTTKPTVSGQFIVPVGAAASSDTLVVTPLPSPVVQPIGATTAFTGPVTAPSFVSTAGFRSTVSFGSYYNPNVAAGTYLPNELVFPGGESNNATPPQTARVRRTMGAAGFVRALCVYFDPIYDNQSAVNRPNNLLLFRNNVEILRTTGNGNGLFVLAKDSFFAFNPGDVLHVGFVYTQPGVAALRFDLNVEFNA